MLWGLVATLHVIVCLALILIVLLQQGKGSDLSSAFGGGGAQTMFGARGAATVINKLTTVAAILFMVTSLSLAMLSGAPEEDLFSGDEELVEPPVAQPTAVQAPAGPQTDETSSAADVDQPADTGEPVVPADESAVSSDESAAPGDESSGPTDEAAVPADESQDEPQPELPEEGF